MNFDRFGNVIFKNHSRKDKNDVRKFLKKKFLKNNSRYKEMKKLIPKTIYSKKLLFEFLINKNKSVKNLSVLGHLHHGKSSLIRNLASSLHLINQNSLFETFSEFFFIEQQRKTTLKGSLTTLLLLRKNGKACVTSFFDCPGHPEFFDQTINSLSLSDGSIMVVDIAEGVLLGTELGLRTSILSGFPVILVVNALDRMMIEYNASPREMFIKMVQIIDALNFIIEECLLKLDSKKRKKILFFNPIANNVCFSSFLQGWSFSLFQFSELYLSSQPSTCFSVEELVEKLWSHTLLSDSFQNSLKKKFFFTNSLFEEFVLIPLFKIIFLNLGESVLHIRKFIETELGVFGITKIELNLNREKLMSYCMGLFFGGCRDIKLIPNHTGLISAIFKNIFISKKIKNMNMKNIGIFWRLKFAGVTGKVFHSSNENKILLLSRLVKGKLLVEDHIFLSTETHQYYHQQKTLCKHRIKKIRLPVGRYSLTIKKIKTNCVFMIALQEKRIRKSAIFTDQKTSFLHLQSIFSSTLRNLIQNGSVAPFIIHIQPILSGNLKNLLKSIRNCVKIYPILASKFQKPEKISITGTGELYLDSFLFDLTEYFGNFDLKVSLPDIVRKETVAKQKKTQKIKWNKELHLQIKKNQKIFTRPYNDQNLKIHRFHWENFKKNQQFLKKTIDSGSVSYSFEKYNALSTFHSNSLWAFGPKAQYLQNCFLTNESEIGFASNNEKNFFSEGFQWSLKKGPILKMPLNEVEFILNTNRKENVSEKIKQIYPAKLRRIFQKNFLKKYPKIQEPIFFFESFLSRYFFKTFSKFLHLKNGCIFSIKFKEQNDTLFIRGKISAFESLHFEKDLKILTKGNGTCTLFFDEWDLSASEHQKKLLSTLI